jgi:hypothetical protein
MRFPASDMIALALLLKLVGELQSHLFRTITIVNVIAGGDILDGYDKLCELDRMNLTPAFGLCAPLPAGYLPACEVGKSVLAVAPTGRGEQN